MALKKDSKILHFAEGLDALRVVPRLILGTYAWVVWDLLSWYKSMPEPTDNQMWLVNTFCGLSTVIIGLYLQSGRAWGANGNVSWRAPKPYAAPQPPVVVQVPQTAAMPMAGNKYDDEG